MQFKRIQQRHKSAASTAATRFLMAQAAFVHASERTYTPYEVRIYHYKKSE